ncbi:MULTISPECIES: lysylphosphatidylglycerol synthase transmembrane domain-containing protein [Gordonia]|uniref:lysylphosphatidylglycerol synthase transmembrane domain-containing protein n=1 Tax=Gordonia TaxID=2053 RepID=UPI0020433642|nr:MULTISPECIES: lysylphosphatidylglycerol synthase transmembrane domain-containing protein [Gordonia]MCM3897265.1 flippase-like domain-containing protein [Gordonia sputi]
MDVDGREITVTGDLLQPLIRRTSDIFRLVVSAIVLIVVVVSSLITRGDWVALEKSISDIVGVLTPTQAGLVYLAYGIAILALPFMILVGLLAARQWRLLWAYATAAAISFLALSVSENGIAAPAWHFDRGERLDSLLSQFLDDPRWIAMLAAVLTVSGPWLPARWRRWWWILLLAFVPIHLVVSAVVPARAVLGLATGWFVGALVVWVAGTPALVVPLEDAARMLARRGVSVTSMRVIRPASRGPLELVATADRDVIVDLYGPNQRSAGLLREFWRKIRLRSEETAPLQLSVHRMVEHRGLMTLTVDGLGLSNSSTLAVALLDRDWTMFAGTPPMGVPLNACSDDVPVAEVWGALHALHSAAISHGDLRGPQITVIDGAIRFGGFHFAEFGASDVQLQSDIAQLLVTTTDLYGSHAAVTAAINAFGADAVLIASRRLSASALPRRIRDAVADSKGAMSSAREEIRSQTGADEIRAETITRFSRSQIIQLVLLVALVYVAYPFISTVPTFFSELRTLDWWWALLGLAASMLTYVGAAAALWACADGLTSMWRLTVMQFANTFAATTTPAGVGGLALSTRFLQKAGLGGVRATTAVALQQSVQVIVHVVLLLFFTAVAGTSADLSHFVPSATVLYLVAGIVLGALGLFLFIPKLRHWLGASLGPKLREVLADLRAVAREPRRLAIITLGCGATTLGGALALWASVHAFGGTVSFITVTVVTMVGGTLASAAPTPGGVGAVEAALIGGLAAFGVPSAVAVPGVLLYRVLTCWLPVFVGWPVMHWLTRKNMI